MHCFSPAIGNSQLNHEGHESEEVDDNNEDEENEKNGVSDWQLGLEAHMISIRRRRCCLSVRTFNSLSMDG